MSILQQVPAKMQAILETVADEVAVTTGLVKRKRKLTGSALTQILVFGWLENPGRVISNSLKLLPCIQVSRQALEQRLTPETPEMLKLTLDAAKYLKLPVSEKPCLYFSSLVAYVQDSTWLTMNSTNLERTTEKESST